MDYSIMEFKLSEMLGLSRRPVAIMFRESAPASVAKFAGTEPSGCSFWQLAAGGMTFYTVPGDHCNCAVGNYTHNFSISPGHAGELEQALSRLSSSGYVKMEEIPSIPRLNHAPQIVVYSPLGNTPLDPDVVIVVARPMQVMVIQEAGVRANVGLQLSLFGRPTCMSLPIALGQGMVICAGCLGNRIYTGLDDDELYVLLPGKVLRKVVTEVQSIVESNTKLANYYRARRKSLRSRPQ